MGLLWFGLTCLGKVRVCLVWFPSVSFGFLYLDYIVLYFIILWCGVLVLYGMVWL